MSSGLHLHNRIRSQRHCEVAACTAAHRAAVLALLLLRGRTYRVWPTVHVLDCAGRRAGGHRARHSHVRWREPRTRGRGPMRARLASLAPAVPPCLAPSTRCRPTPSPTLTLLARSARSCGGRRWCRCPSLWCGRCLVRWARRPSSHRSGPCRRSWCAAVSGLSCRRWSEPSRPPCDRSRGAAVAGHVAVWWHEPMICVCGAHRIAGAGSIMVQTPNRTACSSSSSSFPRFIGLCGAAHARRRGRTA